MFLYHFEIQKPYNMILKVCLLLNKSNFYSESLCENAKMQKKRKPHYVLCEKLSRIAILLSKQIIFCKNAHWQYSLTCDRIINFCKLHQRFFVEIPKLTNYVLRPLSTSFYYQSFFGKENNVNSSLQISFSYFK